MLHFHLIRVTAVRHIRNHVLWLEFSDGLNGEIDLENELIPPHRMSLLYEWRDLHRDELIENWDRLREGRPPKPIEPLA